MSKEIRSYPNHHSATCKGKKVRRSSANFRRGKYKQQWFKTEKNRKRKQLKHLAFHPNDIQLLKQLKEKTAPSQ